MLRYRTRTSGAQNELVLLVQLVVVASGLEHLAREVQFLNPGARCADEPPERTVCSSCLSSLLIVRYERHRETIERYTTYLSTVTAVLVLMGLAFVSEPI